jgi:hypothetical protein
MLSRRGLLIGLGAIIAAPAIVRIQNIMPVRAVVLRPNLDEILRVPYGQMVEHRERFDVWLRPSQFRELLGYGEYARLPTAEVGTIEVGTYNGFTFHVRDDQEDPAG